MPASHGKHEEIDCHGSTTLRVTQTTLAGRHYQGTSNKLRKATCDLRRALFTSTNTSNGRPSSTRADGHPTRGASQSSSVRVGFDTCHSTARRRWGDAARRPGVRVCAACALCTACWRVACVLHLWRDGAHGRWAARGGMRTSNSFAIEDDLGVAELRLRRRGCSRDHVQLRRLKAVGLRVLAGAGRPSVGRGARRDRSCCGIGADLASTLKLNQSSCNRSHCLGSSHSKSHRVTRAPRSN